MYLVVLPHASRRPPSHRCFIGIDLQPLKTFHFVDTVSIKMPAFKSHKNIIVAMSFQCRILNDPMVNCSSLCDFERNWCLISMVFALTFPFDKFNRYQWEAPISWELLIKRRSCLVTLDPAVLSNCFSQYPCFAGCLFYFYILNVLLVLGSPLGCLCTAEVVLRSGKEKLD